MNDDEKGKRFLKLIDDQNNFQWEIVAKLTSLISSDWNSDQLKNELKTLSELLTSFQIDSPSVNL